MTVARWTAAGLAGLSATAALVLAAGWARPQPPELLLTVVVRAGSQSQAQVLERITTPLETSLRALDRVRFVRSVTREGLAVLRAVAGPGADSDRLVVGSWRRIQQLAGAQDLAAEVDVASAGPASVVLAVRGGEEHSRSAFVEAALVPALEALPQVGSIEVLGLTRSTVVVTPRPEQLLAQGLVVADLIASLGALGQVVPLGLVRQGGLERQLVVSRAARTLEQLGREVVATPNGPAALADLAQVEVESVGDGSAFRLDGDDGVLLRVVAPAGADPAPLGRLVEGQVAALRIPAGLALERLDDPSHASGSQLLLRYRLPPGRSAEERAQLGRDLEQLLRRTLEPWSARSCWLLWPAHDPVRDAFGETGLMRVELDRAKGVQAAAAALAVVARELPDVSLAVRSAESEAAVMVVAPTVVALTQVADDTIRTLEDGGVSLWWGGFGEQGLQLRWRAGVVDPSPGSVAALERQVASGLGDVEVGRVAIAAVAPRVLVRAAGIGADHFPVATLRPDGSRELLALSTVAQLVPTTRSAPVEREEGRFVRYLELSSAIAPDARARLEALVAQADTAARADGGRVQLVEASRPRRWWLWGLGAVRPSGAA